MAGSEDREYVGGSAQGVTGAALVRACPSQSVMDSSPEMPPPPQETMVNRKSRQSWGALPRVAEPRETE